METPGVLRRRGAHDVWSVAVIALSTLLLPQAAIGQVTVAVIDISLEDELEAEVIDPVSIALDQGIRDAALTVIMPDVVAERLRQAGFDTSCVEGSCLHEVGALASADALLRARVSQVGQLYTIEIELLLARNGERLAELNSTCEVCTWTEALDAITNVAAEIRNSIPGVLDISIATEGATVTIDNTVVDVSQPLTFAAGSHHIEASLAGHQPWSRDVEISRSETTEISIEMTPIVAQSAVEERESRPLQILGWVAGGLAIGALVPGVLWLVLDGNCPSGTDTDPETGALIVCREVYDSWPEGLAMTIGSGVLAIMSVVFFVVDSRLRRTDRRVSMAAAPTTGGGFLTLRLTY